MQKIKKGALAGLLLSFGAVSVFAAGNGNSGTSSLSVTVSNESAVTITNATTTLSETAGAGIFGAPYTGTTSLTYKVRTTQSSGGGDITVQITSDFNGTGGPSVATPQTGDALTYSCTSAVGTACAGPVTASTSAATNVAHFGSDAHSAQGANNSSLGSVTWSLPNDPVYVTGAYTATATFSISAT